MSFEKKKCGCFNTVENLFNKFEFCVWKWTKDFGYKDEKTNKNP